jgi:hypothetical protein
VPRIPRTTILIVLLGSLACALPVHSEVAQEFLPTDHWANDVIYELYAGGAWGKWPIGTRPWCRGDIADRIQEITRRDSSDHPLSPTERNLLFRLQLEFAHDLKRDSVAGDMGVRAGGELYGLGGFEQHDEPLYRGRVQGFLGVGTGPWWVRVRADIDSHGELDPTFFGQTWQDRLTGTVDLAYFTFSKGGFELEAGRDFIRWGPAPQDALLLNDQSPPFDMARFAYHHRWFDFSFFFTGLDSAFANPADDSADIAPNVKRYLSGHRLEVRPLSGLEMALSEVIVWGGPSRQLEAYYLNPFLPYYWEQLNFDSDDNPLWSIDASWQIPHGPMTYGELLIDDFQIDFKSEPHQVGWTLGFNWLNVPHLEGSYLTVDWSHIEPGVYGQSKPYNRYLNNRVGMGSTMGPDAERYTLRWRQHVSRSLDVTLRGLLLRKGEREIDTPQQPPLTRNEFPSGVVETTTETELGVYYQPSSLVRFDLRGGYRWLENPDHVAGVSQDGGFVSASVALSGWLTGSF